MSGKLSVERFSPKLRSVLKKCTTKKEFADMLIEHINEDRDLRVLAQCCSEINKEDIECLPVFRRMRDTMFKLGLDSALASTLLMSIFQNYVHDYQTVFVAFIGLPSLFAGMNLGLYGRVENIKKVIGKYIDL